MFRPNSFYSSLTPIFYGLKIFGLAPFKITDECYQKSKINLTWSLFFTFSAFFCNIVIINCKHVVGTSLLTAIPDFIHSSLSPVSTFLYILLGCIFSNKLLKSFQAISSFDEELNSFLLVDLSREYRKSKMYAFVALLITFLYTMLSFSLGLSLPPVFVFEEFIQNFSLFVMPMMINAFVNLQFCAIILCLKQRFRWLNQRIARISEDYGTEKYSKDSKTQIEKFRTISPVLEKIRVKHHVLCMISKEINACYSVQILLMVLRSFVTLIIGLFYCARYLIFQTTLTTEYALYNVVQLSLAMAELVVLAVACSCTAAEARKTGILIHSTMRFSNDCKQKLKRQIIFFSVQLLHQNVKFTTCRTFEVAESLLLTVIGAISTYLVLVVQFQIQDYKRISSLQPANI